MITEMTGDLLEAKCDAVVNTVNCVGVMGKGIALQVKRRYPTVFKEYEKACKAGVVEIGKMLPLATGELERPHWVINFPTKKHWRSPSRLSYISDGLKNLRSVVEELGLDSIAIPPLGAGNGGLNWNDVAPLIREAFRDSDVDVHLYAPTTARQFVRGAATQLRVTRGRATVMALMDRYFEGRASVEPLASDSLSHLELQKVLYFADFFDPSLKYKYAQGQYGPYSDVARIVVQEMEGSYISGFGDGSDKVLELRPIALTESGRTHLVDYFDQPESDDVLSVVDKVMGVVGGFEEPYGIELLASTHWVATREGASTPELASHAVRSWTHRKGRLFTDRHVGLAFQHLAHVGAITV